MSQRHPFDAPRRHVKLLIATAALAAVAFPVAADAGGLTVPQAASAPTPITPKTAPSAPAGSGVPAGAPTVDSVGPSSGDTGGSGTASPTTGGDFQGNPFGPNTPADMDAMRRQQEAAQRQSEAKLEEARLAIDQAAALNFFKKFTDDPDISQYLPEDPEPFFGPDPAIGILLPSDGGGIFAPFYSFLRIAEQIENNDHNTGAF